MWESTYILRARRTCHPDKTVWISVRMSMAMAMVIQKPTRGVVDGAAAMALVFFACLWSDGLAKAVVLTLREEVDVRIASV